MGKSFIKENGDLEVRIKVEDVTWFDFLWLSRSSGSKHGGWNNKTHWWSWGIELLTREDSEVFLKKWTEMSLRRSGVGLPRPRERYFMFVRKHSESRVALERRFRGYELPHEQATENELSYALFNDGYEKLQPIKGVKLLGYEIPLSAEAEGQLKVDLFGVSEGGDAIEIIELKKATNEGDSPLIALTEGICYALQTLRCRAYLLKTQELTGRDCAFARINLTILAPEKYWAFWRCPPEAGITQGMMLQKLLKVVQGVNAGISNAGIESQVILSLETLTSICSR
jgi:hypothetical protein